MLTIILTEKIFFIFFQISLFQYFDFVAILSCRNCAISSAKYPKINVIRKSPRNHLKAKINAISKRIAIIFWKNFSEKMSGKRVLNIKYF